MGWFFCSEPQHFQVIWCKIHSSPHRMLWLAPSVFSFHWVMTMWGEDIWSQGQPSRFQQESCVTLFSRIWQKYLGTPGVGERLINVQSINFVLVRWLLQILYTLLLKPACFSLYLSNQAGICISLLLLNHRHLRGHPFFSFSIYLPIHIFESFLVCFSTSYTPSVRSDWDKGGMNPKWTRLKAYTVVELVPGV